MNIATLNADGNGSAFEALAQSLRVPAASIWKQGQARRNGAPHALRALSERGISLSVTAYPTSDEANAK